MRTWYKLYTPHPYINPRLASGRTARIVVRMRLLRVAPPLLLAATAAAPDLHARRALTVFISADMEGIAGVVSGAQRGPAGFEYARFMESARSDRPDLSP